MTDISRLNVLHLVAGNMFGGVETMLVTLARCKDYVRSMTTIVGITSEGRLAAELREAGCEVTNLGDVRLRYPQRVLRARKTLATLIRSARIDVVICHSSWPKVVFGKEVRRLGVPLVVWQHGPFNGRRALDKLAIGSAPDLYITNSLFTAETIDKYAAGSNKVVIHYPAHLVPVDVTAGSRERLRAEAGANSSSVVIVQVSRIEPWKGHVLHFRALAKLPPEIDWQCWVVGGPQTDAERRYDRSLRDLVESLGIANRVRFLGQRTDVADLLVAADIHCQPNTGPEAFGITFVEGLAAGLPVVTTDLGGGVEVVTSACGIVVPPGDVDALSKTLEVLCRDEALRRRLGRAGPARAKELCDPERQMQELRDVLSGVVEKYGEIRD